MMMMMMKKNYNDNNNIRISEKNSSCVGEQKWGTKKTEIR